MKSYDGLGGLSDLFAFLEDLHTLLTSLRALAAVYLGLWRLIIPTLTGDWCFVMELAYATPSPSTKKDLGASIIVDMATLTGAQVGNSSNTEPVSISSS